MNTIITSKEAILSGCKELVAENGLQVLNMRTVAKKCNVSVGSVYNYFSSKEDLIASTIQDIWRYLFHMESTCPKGDSFLLYVEWIFSCVQSGILEYPNFFTAHSLIFANTEKEKAHQMMDDCFGHIKSNLLTVLQQDKNISPKAFTEHFTAPAFVEFVFSNLLMLLVRQENSCTMLTELIKRTIY